MLKKIRNRIKSGTYHVLQSAKLMIKVISRKLTTFDYKKYRYQHDTLSTLPYPTQWDKIHKYKKLIVEIGMGHGELVRYLGQNRPEDLVVGFEVVNRFAKLSAWRSRQLSNVMAFKGSAYNEIPFLFAKDTIDEIYILFPDPWHKKRHNKRRPITAEFFNQIYSLLRQGGKIFVATDWLDYYEFIRAEADKVAHLYDVKSGSYEPAEFNLPETHYYKKWLKVGREFRFVELMRI